MCLGAKVLLDRVGAKVLGVIESAGWLVQCVFCV
jgi:hypothetical protein